MAEVNVVTKRLIYLAEAVRDLPRTAEAEAVRTYLLALIGELDHQGLLAQ